jgi:hypothetical protein
MHKEESFCLALKEAESILSDRLREARNDAEATRKLTARLEQCLGLARTNLDTVRIVLPASSHKRYIDRLENAEQHFKEIVGPVQLPIELC